MGYQHTCYRDKRLGDFVVSLDKCNLDSFMPWAVTKHKLLEGGGSLLVKIELFPDYSEALGHYHSLVCEPILKYWETTGRERVNIPSPVG